jgi:hypothetical protein
VIQCGEVLNQVGANNAICADNECCMCGFFHVQSYCAGCWYYW